MLEFVRITRLSERIIVLVSVERQGQQGSTAASESLEVALACS